MGTNTKRSWKLQEFVAHASNVNCLALGPKSGRVMVTGGEDKKVNMWAVGKPNCIMSLSGHTSPVECVRFGIGEEMVVAGSMSGGLKIWDLEAAKIVRTLTGHKSSIRSADFHPYGDFVASGSLDTNIKLWDIRRKGCIFTYKSHTNSVNCLRFSPDGRWIASGGEDSTMKLWDLTAGKLLTEFKQHTGPVNTIQFHPNEFLIASGSSDRTVKFWDLESFQLVSSTDGDASPIRCICFHEEGACMYASTQDGVKVYGWEPVKCFDSVHMNMGNVMDIGMAQNQVIGAAISQNNVSTYVVDIQRMQPFAAPSAGGNVSPQVSSPPTQMSASGRRSFYFDRPKTQSTKGNETPKEDPEEPSSSPTNDAADDDQAVITDPKDYKEIFQPKRTLARDDPPRRVDPFPAPPDDVMPAPVSSSASKPASSRPSAKPAQAVVPERDRPGAEKDRSSPRAVPSAPPAPTSKNRPAGGDASSVIPADRNEPSGLNMQEFLPKKVTPTAEMSETEVMSSIMKGHVSMVAVLSGRSKNLQIVRALYTGGNAKAAMDSALTMDDKAVIMDVLNVFLQKPGLWNLDLCVGMLPKLPDLINSKYESYVQTACSTLKLILRNFAPVIKSNVTAPPSAGVDISREERYNKCKECYGHLMTIRSVIESKNHVPGKMGNLFREIQLLMSQLD